jgi:hypothetical protein
VYGGKDKFLLFGRREDLVEVNGYTERDEEEASYSRTDPVGRL